MKIKPDFIDTFKGSYLAGGAILSMATKTNISDYDIYPKSNEALLDILYYLMDDSDWFIVNITDKAITFKTNSFINDKGDRLIIQIMTYDTFETPEKIFEHFDFSVCMAAFDYDTEKYIFHENFYPDIASKTIRFNPKTKYPLNSILRIQKYKEKGYYTSKPELLKMILTSIQKGMPNSWEELEKEIGGTYGKEITLNASDKECTYENIIEILDEISHCGFIQKDKSEEYRDIDINMLEYIYSNKNVEYIETSSGECFSVLNGKIDHNITNIIKEKQLKPNDLKIDKSKFIKIDNFTMYGYKQVKITEENKYKPKVYPNNKIEYELNKETIYENYPYLFVFDKIENGYRSENERYIGVSYSTSDIRKLTTYNETTVSKLKVEQEFLLAEEVKEWLQKNNMQNGV